jgi:hypothetical protein
MPYALIRDLLEKPSNEPHDQFLWFRTTVFLVVMDLGYAVILTHVDLEEDFLTTLRVDGPLAILTFGGPYLVLCSIYLVCKKFSSTEKSF